VPRWDYTTVGHVTADVLADGSERPGGGAFYSALQAARLGRRARIVTQGVPSELERLLEPYCGELELEVHPAAHTTTLHTRWRGDAREQRVLAWAGPMREGPAVDTAVLHLAPVARETPAGWRGSAAFVGITPQGLVRTWTEPGGLITRQRLGAEQLPRRFDAAVISRAERESCGWLIDAARVGGLDDRAAKTARTARSAVRGAAIAVTAGADATVVYLPSGETLRLEVPHVERSRDDLGAGDVFAAAFFLALHDGRAAAEAAAFANAAAAVRVSGAGPDAVGRREAIETQLRAPA
jgi:hypothetical protein